MNITVALSVGLPLGLFDVQVGDPVPDVQRTPERNVDTVVGWQIPNEALSIV